MILSPTPSSGISCTGSSVAVGMAVGGGLFDPPLLGCGVLVGGGGTGVLVGTSVSAGDGTVGVLVGGIGVAVASGVLVGGDVGVNVEPA